MLILSLTKAALLLCWLPKIGLAVLGLALFAILLAVTIEYIGNLLGL